MKFLRGAVVALVAGAVSPVHAAGDPARGQTLFSRCSACHTVTEQNRIGPHLSDVYGRVAGTASGYSYSKGMAAYATTWDETTLDAFLTRPNQVVPGTKMTAGAVTNPQDRADIVAYLRSLQQQ